MGGVHFFAQDTDFKPPKPGIIKRWIKKVIEIEQRKPGTINYIFCSDPYLLGMNREYLKHDTFTDIITFDTSDDGEALEGDIFISIDRVRENARELGIVFEEELRRVMIHGVLHLIGYGDKSAEQKKEMRKKEDAYLSLQKTLLKA